MTTGSYDHYSYRSANKDGTLVDRLWYGLLREEWQGQQTYDDQPR